MEHRTADGPFDVVYIGNLPDENAQAADTAAAYEKAGVTWWSENCKPWSDTPAAKVREKLRGGPLTK